MPQPLTDDFDKYVTPAAPKPKRQREFRTDRNNNPIAAAVTTGGKNQFTQALDDAEIPWEHGDQFPGNPKLSTIRIKGDPYEGARAILSNSNAIKWYRGSTGKSILPKYGVRTNQDFAKLPIEHQNDIINNIYQTEGGHGKIKPTDDDFDRYVSTDQPARSAAPATDDDFDSYVTPASVDGAQVGASGSVSGQIYPNTPAKPGTTPQVTSTVKDDVGEDLTPPAPVAKPIEFQETGIIKPNSLDPVENVANILSAKKSQQATGLARLQSEHYKTPESQDVGERVKIPFKAGSDPTPDEVVSGFLSVFGPDYVELGKRYKAETGQNILKLTASDFQRDPDGSYYVRPSRGAVDFINAYGRGGLEESDKEGERQRQEYLAAQNKAIEESKPDIKEAEAAVGRTKGDDLSDFALRGVTSGAARAAQGVGSVLPESVGSFERKAAVMRAAAEESDKLNPANTNAEQVAQGLGEAVPGAMMLAATAPLGTAQLPALGVLEGATPEERLRGGLEGAATQATFGLGPHLAPNITGTAQKLLTGATLAGIPTGEALAHGESPLRAIASSLPYVAMPFLHKGAKERPELPEVQSKETLGIQRAQSVPDFEGEIASREASIKPTFLRDDQGNAVARVLNPEEVAQGAKPKIRPVHQADTQTRDEAGRFAEVPTEAQPTPPAERLPTEGVQQTPSPSVKGEISGTQPPATTISSLDRNRGVDRASSASQEAQVSPVVAAPDLVPERPETIAAQMEALKAGTRDAVLVTPGEQRPKLPERISTLRTKEGVFYYDPSRVSAETIRAKVTDGTHGELLGHVADKPGLGEPTAVVTAKDAQGNEVQSSAVPPEKTQEQVAATQAQNPEAKIETGGPELAQKVIEDRVAEPTAFNWHTRAENGEWKILNPKGEEVSRVSDQKVAEQIVKEMRESDASPQGQSLVPAIRRMGGIQSGEDSKGELSYFTNKESGTSGIVNNKSGRSAQEMATRLAEEGYGLGDWAEVNPKTGIGYEIDLNRFREAVQEEISGQKKHYSTESQLDYETEHRQHAQTGQDEHDTDATVSLLENEQSGVLYDKIAIGEATPSEVSEFREHANNLGISGEAQDKLIASARKAGVQEIGDLPAETGQPSERITSVKNATTTAERAERGLDPVEKELVRGDQEIWSKAKSDVDSGVADPERLAAEVARKPRSLDEDETAQLLYHRTKLHVQREAQMKAAEQAIALGDKVKAAQHNLDVAETERLLGVNEEADVRAGQKQGRAFRIRQLMVKQDFSLGAMERRARVARGGDLSATDKATIKEQYDQIAKLTTELEKIRADQEFRLTSDAVKKIVRDERFSARKERRVTTRKALDDEVDTLKEQLAAVWSKQKRMGSSTIQPLGGLGKLDPEGVATRLVLKIARNRVQAGYTSAEGLVDVVHEKIADTVDLTKREVAEMISGYGKTFEMSQDAADRKLRELKSIIAANLGKADIIEKGIRPLRRGIQRDKPTANVRAAMRDLRDTLRANGMEVERSKGSPEEQQKSVMDAAKTQTRNRIEDLTKWIADGKRTVASKTEIIPDTELAGLRSERDRLQKVFDALDDPEADQKSIENALRSVTKSIADLESKVASGDIAPAARKTVSPWSEQLGKQQQRRSDLQKQLADMRKAAEPKSDPETARIEAALKTTERSIIDMQDRLRTGNLENKGTKTAPWSPELGKLKREQADLQKQLRDARKAARPAVDTEQRRIEQSLKATEKSIANLESKVKQGETATVVREGSQSAYSPEISAAKKYQATLRKILNDMRVAEKKAERDANRDSVEDEARKLLAAHKALNTRLEKQAKDYQQRIDDIKKTGQPYQTPPKKAPFARNAAERAIEERVQRLKQQFEADNRKASLTPWDWASRLVVGTGRAAKLTYGATIGKLTSAATGRIVTAPVEDAVGVGVGKVFPDLYKGAAAEGPGSTPEAAKIASDLYKGPKGEGLLKDHIAGIERLWKSDTWRQVVNKLVTGKSQEDVLYGKNVHETDFLGIPGQVHGAFKEPVRQVTFYRQFRRRLGAIAREGKLDINDPQVQMGAATEAWNDAARSIFMQRNFISDGFNNMVAGWERSGRAGPKTAAFLARLEFPITRVPVNIVGEGLNYTFGLGRALGETGYRSLVGGGKGERFSLNESFRKMTPEQKDSLMRAYKKGGVGLVMALWGYLQPQIFGGYYQKGDKRGKDEPKFGEMMFFGHRIPSWATHIPILFPAQMGATFRRLVDAGEAKGHPDAILEAAGATAKSAVSQVPFYETPARFYTGMEGPRQAAQFLGEQARGFIPGGIQEYAKYQDKNAVTGEPNVRRPEGTFKERFGQTVKLGIPSTPVTRGIARQTVPMGKVFGTAATKASGEVQRLNVNIEGATKQPDETPDEFKVREERENRFIKKMIEAVVAKPEYDAETDANKILWLKQAKEKAVKDSNKLKVEPIEKPKSEFPIPEVDYDEETKPVASFKRAFMERRPQGFKSRLTAGAA